MDTKSINVDMKSTRVDRDDQGILGLQQFVENNKNMAIMASVMSDQNRSV